MSCHSRLRRAGPGPLPWTAAVVAGLALPLATALAALPQPHTGTHLPPLHPGQTPLTSRPAPTLPPAVPELPLGERQDLHVPAPPAETLDLTLVADGFRLQDRADFLAAAQQLTQQFLASDPYAGYRGLVAVRALFVPSPQAGASHPADNVLVANAFGTTFGHQGLQRLAVADEAAVQQAVAQADPASDLAIVLVNDATFGGSGGTVPVVTRHPQGLAILRHELGHRLAGLADEYGGPFQGTLATEPNVAAGHQLQPLKWAQWVPPQTPVPTPAAAVTGLQAPVGAYEGARYQSHGLYRPAPNCLMRSLDMPPCPVCREATILALHRHTRLLRQPQPAVAVVRCQAGSCPTFRATLAEVPTLSVRWLRDGRTVATTPAWTPGPTDQGTFQLALEVRDTTGHVRSDPAGDAVERQTWQVEVTPPSPLACQARPVPTAGGRWAVALVFLLALGRVGRSRRRLSLLTVLAVVLVACREDPAASPTIDDAIPGDAAADLQGPGDVASSLATCPQVFACMATSCQAPLPPPPDPGRPPDVPPPPLLPSAASPECLAQCADRVVGPGRSAALALAACADLHCGGTTCLGTSNPVGCFENCLLASCQPQLTACPGAHGPQGCAAGLRCSWQAPAFDFAHLLACGETLDGSAVSAYGKALPCVLAPGSGTGTCPAPLEACACDRPPSLAGQNSCALLLLQFDPDTPCHRALLTSALRPAAVPLAEAVTGCLATHCATCQDGACLQACAATQCGGPLLACLTDAATGQPGQGTGSCLAGAACLDACWLTRTDGCHATCARQMTAGAWQAWQGLFACEWSQCGCNATDGKCLAQCRKGACLQAWTACGG